MFCFVFLPRGTITSYPSIHRSMHFTFNQPGKVKQYGQFRIQNPKNVHILVAGSAWSEPTQTPLQHTNATQKGPRCGNSNPQHFCCESTMNESMLKEHKKVNNSTCYLATRDLFQKPVFVRVDIALKCEQAFILKKKNWNWNSMHTALGVGLRCAAFVNFGLFVYFFFFQLQFSVQTFK